MDELQQRISEDLAGMFRGGLEFDAVTRAMYATDASLYEIRPLGVAYPQDREDVAVLARYASENDIPLVPRGAGTGLAGGAVGTGLTVDLSRHMTRIESIGTDSVRVQTGVVLNVLNRALRETGRYFPPDPSNAAVTTIGGMLAVDAAGSHASRVGSTRDHVKSIETVLADGTLVEMGGETSSSPPPPPAVEESLFPALDDLSGVRRVVDGETRRHQLTQRLRSLLKENEALIRERQRPLLRNCSGYHLRNVLVDDELHLPRLLVGSEGTLALFTSATLHTSPLPAHRGVVMLLFGHLEQATAAVCRIAEQQPSACDLMDRRLLSLAREADPRFASLIPRAAEAGLIVEQTGFSDAEVRERLRSVIAAVQEVDSSAVVAQEAYEFDDVELLWSLPTRVVPLLAGLKGTTRPLPIFEDIAVPPAVLNEVLTRAQKVFQKHGITASLYAHAATGQLHMRPFLSPPAREDGPPLEALARELYEMVVACGGTISGEHGDGLARTSFLRTQYGPLYRVFQQVKDIFDPHNLLNPGKIVSDDPHLTIKHFREHRQEENGLVDLQLRWSAERVNDVALRCNGCGTCRTQDAGLRMCPFFRNEPREEASPRSKANVMRGLLTGQIGARDMATDPVREMADLCFNCKQCQLECPSAVDIPHLAIEAKAASVAANGLSRADWILSRAHSFGQLGCALAPVSNWLLHTRWMRWLVEKTVGIARERKLPTFARKPFLKASRRPWGDPERAKQSPIVYFVDHYANYHDPELAWALVRILEHHGANVYVPQEQTGSGMAMVSAGDLEAARELAAKNVRILGELAREGSTIVCTEPAAALCLRDEYPLLLDHPDVGPLSRQVQDAGSLLLSWHREGKLRTDFRDIERAVGYHTPCHSKALHQPDAYATLLSLIPGMRLHRIEKGCSGMAGAFGLTRHNFATSLEIGDELIVRMQEPDLELGSSECSSCKIQMEQGTRTPTLHPLKLLAYAYGLMPGIAQRMQPAGKRLTVS